MYYTGFADEACKNIDGQIKATLDLGWKYIESRNIGGVNIHDLPEAEFEEVCGKLADANISINCFGSAVANWGWSPFSEEDFQKTTEQLKRALVRMEKLNCKMIRAMSFVAQWERPAFDPEVEKEVFKKVSALVKMCEDAGVMYLHENCNNYGGMSWKHTLKLIENVKSPNFRLVFDTGNPVLNFDRSTGSDKLEVLQDSFEFYRNVREFIYYVHIKDAICEEADNVKGGFAKAKFTVPGEGNGRVKEIVKDLLKNGYDGGFSIEPHMVKVFHEEAADDNSVNTNYAEYGRRFVALVENAKAEIAAGI